MSALTLRLLASVCMLLDHIGYCLHVEILRYIGRLAFPIYVFLMVNGFYHTRDRMRYAGRIALFAILSQIPFSLFCTNTIYYSKLNVLMTLLLGLLVIWAGESLMKHRYFRYISLLPALLVAGLCNFGLIHTDYGAKGILLALVFWLFRGKPLWITVGAFLAVWHGSLLSLVSDLLKGAAPTMPGQWEMVQTFSLLSLPLIFLYNNKPGKLPQNSTAKRAIQLSFYAFYPIHMLILRFLFLQ